MTVSGWLIAYCVAILLISLFGGYLPFLGKVTHGKLQFYLSGAAGFMLGAAFFHVMPDAMKMSEPYFGWWMSLAVVGLFCIERFIAPHSHEINGQTNHNHEHNHDHNHGESCEATGEPGHTSNSGTAGEHRAAAPAVAGWAAVFGLTLHTFMNGLGLAGNVQEEFSKVALPGIAIFIAIFFHKPADALAISTVLSRKGVSRQKIFLVQLGFALMVPIGVVAFCLWGSFLEEETRKQLIGAALAFSAGTFIFVALSDLLPEVQFHRHDRVPLFLSLVGGVAFMGLIALLEGHDEHDHDHSPAKVGQHGKYEPAAVTKSTIPTAATTRTSITTSTGGSHGGA